MAYWLTEQFFLYFLRISFFLFLNWEVILIATNLLVIIDAVFTTSCFSRPWYGMYIQKPAQLGPGFPLHGPSMKAIFRSWYFLFICSVVSCSVCSYCCLDLVVYDPKLFQYEGLWLGLRHSSKSVSVLSFWCVFPFQLIVITSTSLELSWLGLLVGFF